LRVRYQRRPLGSGTGLLDLARVSRQFSHLGVVGGV